MSKARDCRLFALQWLMKIFDTAFLLEMLLFTYRRQSAAVILRRYSPYVMDESDEMVRVVGSTAFGLRWGAIAVTRTSAGRNSSSSGKGNCHSGFSR